MKRLPSALLLLSALVSCTTTEGGKPSDPVNELSAVRIQSIESMITGDKLSEAYQDISFLERNPKTEVPAAELERLKSEVLDRLLFLFQNSIDEENFSAAYQYYCSLSGIDRQELAPEWSSGKLLYRLARSSYEEGDKPLALVYARRALAQGDGSESLLRFLLDLARELDNATMYKVALERLRQEGFEVPADSPESLDIPTVQKMVKGTVTIWVNRGIRLEGGMGYPDRVIGSGFFIDKRGYLLTNYHVVASEVDPEYEGYSRLYIRLSENVEEKIPAKVIGYDRIFDLALVKAEVEPEYVFSYGGSAGLDVGGKIIAIGSPAGLENTVTSGIVSATGRRFLQMGDAIQVDVPINYGNSGGPLLDTAGKLVGIVFAGIEQFEGVNFAIPFDWVEKALPRLYKTEEAHYPWLGIALQEGRSGLEVIYTVPGSPAARAGIREGDILRSLNGELYSKIGDLQSALLDLEYPCLVTLDWERAGRTISGALSLAERPFSPIEVALEKDLRENVLFPLFGMKIEKTGQFLWRTNYVVKKVLPGSIADETGLSKDDPLSIQGWKVDEENRYVLLQIYVKKRKSGFLESVVQMAAYLETDYFI
jgi:serine protease Do